MLIIKNSSGGGSNIITTNKTGNLEVDLFKLLGNDVYPVGTILPFNGDVNILPKEWKVCDGLDGTPNLTDRFVRCVAKPSDSFKGNTGGTADATIQNHTHSVSMTTTGDHKHILPAKSFTTGSGGHHGHTQYGSPYWGHRAACHACAPRAGGTHQINRGATSGNSSAAGSHSHRINFPSAETSSVGAHNHKSKTLSDGSSGKGKNVPKFTKLIHIMKVV